MLILLSVGALVSAQLLPGLLLVKLLDIGRDREEVLVFAAVLGGPVAALIYWLTLLADWAPLYWLLVANASAAALIVPFRTKRAFAWSAKTKLALIALVALVCVPYLMTTGGLYRPDDAGNLLLDQALQRDVLFHLGVTESLRESYPPALLSVGGPAIGYHVGYHLQIAAWARFYGIEPLDGLVRTGTLWQIVLLVGSAFVLARRFTTEQRSRLLAPVLLMGAGFGFLCFARETVDWWSLVFMDVTLVSIFLVNPLLPALPLLLAGFSLLGDFTSNEGRGSLIGSTCCLVFLLVVKMFVGAQVLAGMGLSALVGFRDRKMWTAFLTVSIASMPFLAHTFLAASDSNTDISVRPLEMVRYSMEKIDWPAGVGALAAVGRLDAEAMGWGTAAVALILWGIGFAGVRLVGIRRWATDLFYAGSSLRRTMAWFVLVGFPIALTFRIAPSEAQGLSRLDAQNDVLWFAAASGVLLWFWTAEVMNGRLLATCAVLLALPSTVQHFLYESALEPDRIPREHVLGARAARIFSEPGSLWLDPIDRSRPSPLPYLSGRAVVYDPYVGYDYMFVGRDETDYRRHALSQFWASDDPAFRAWCIDFFDVDYVWQLGEENPAVGGLEQIYSLETVHLYRVHPSYVARETRFGIRTPTSIPLGGGGAPYLGREFKPSGRARELQPGKARLYLPRSAGNDLGLSLRVQPNHGGGTLIVDGVTHSIRARALNIRFTVPPLDEAGLHAMEIEWTGAEPLSIFEFRLDP